MKPIHIIMGMGATAIIGVGAWYYYMSAKSPYKEAKQRGLPPGIAKKKADAPKPEPKKPEPKKAPEPRNVPTGVPTGAPTGAAPAAAPAPAVAPAAAPDKKAADPKP